MKKDAVLADEKKTTSASACSRVDALRIPKSALQNNLKKSLGCAPPLATSSQAAHGQRLVCVERELGTGGGSRSIDRGGAVRQAGIDGASAQAHAAGGLLATAPSSDTNVPATHLGTKGLCAVGCAAAATTRSYSPGKLF